MRPTEDRVIAIRKEGRDKFAATLACGGMRGTSKNLLGVVSKYAARIFLVPLARCGASWRGGGLSVALNLFTNFASPQEPHRCFGVVS